MKKGILARILAMTMVAVFAFGIVGTIPMQASAAAPTNYTSIAVNQTKSVSIATSGGAQYFRFAPTQSGSYTFASSNRTTGDPYGYLLDSNGSTLISNDDGSGNLNFGMTYTCYAGSVYYLKAAMLGSNTGSYNVSVNLNYTVTDPNPTPTPTPSTPAGGDTVDTEAGTHIYQLFNSGATGSGNGSTATNTAVTSLTNNGRDIYARMNSTGDSPTTYLGLAFRVNETVTEQATLQIAAYDVDEGDGERDYIYLVDITAGTEQQLSGYLSGMNDQMNTTTLRIDPSLFTVGHVYRIKVNVTSARSGPTWWVHVRSVSISLTTSGQAVIPDEILDHRFTADISSTGLVTTSLYLQTNQQATYYLEYAATCNNNQYGSALNQTITATPNGTTKAVSFQLESGAPEGNYQVDVILKDANGNVKGTYTVTTSGPDNSTVNYDANGGSNNLPVDYNVYHSGDVITVLFNYIPSKYGYVFQGWARSADAAAPEFTVDGNQTFIIGSDDVTLYAIWAPEACNHNFELHSTTPPTCTEPGENVYLCSLCGEEMTESIDALGHNYVNNVCTRCGAEKPAADSWDGTTDTTWYDPSASTYTIYTAEQLAGFAALVNSGNTFSGKTVYLGNNIDLAGIEWTPIGKGTQQRNDCDVTSLYFSGTFNGNYYTVSNITITQNALSFSGLFGALKNATVICLATKNVNIHQETTYRNKCGGIAGIAENAVIRFCSAEVILQGYATSYPASFGGLLGIVKGSVTIENCYATVDIAGGGHCGGLVGGVYNGILTVNNCYVVGDIVETGVGDPQTTRAAAGFVAFNSGNISAYNSFFSGSLTGSEREYYYFNNGTISNCYHSDMTDDSNFRSQAWIASNLNWDFDTVWEFRTGNDYPVLQGFGSGEPVQHVHEYAETSRTEAGCETYGEVIYTCRCGDTRSELLEPLQHNYAYVETVEPTCTADGYHLYRCLRTGCGSTKMQMLDKIPHYYGDDNVCDGCGHTIPAEHTHSYTEVVVPPTCASVGYTEYTCSCGHSYRDNYIENLTHSWTETVTREKTCTVDGLITHSCANCSAAFVEIVPAGHNWLDTVTTPATCTEDGEMSRTCADCGAVETQVIPAGHNWNDGVETKRPTCTEEGVLHRMCVDCFCEEDAPIAPLGHHYVNGVCTRCGARFIDNITSDTNHPEYGMYFSVDDVKSGYGPDLINEYGVLLDYNPDAQIKKVGVYLTQDGTMWRRCIACVGDNITYATYVPYLSYDEDIKYTGLNSPWINTFRLSLNNRGVWCYSDYATIGVNLEDAYGNLLLSLYDIGQAGAKTRIFDDLDEMKAWLEAPDCFEHTESDWIIDLEPTLETEGQKHTECPYCGAVIQTQVIPRSAVKHQYMEDNKEVVAYYATVEEAFAAATSGTIKLLGDVTVGNLILNSNVTFDLNGYTLTANVLLLLKNAVIIDGGEDCTGGGCLKIDKDNLVYAFGEEKQIISVWNGTDGYIFTKVTFQQISNDRGGGTVQYIFLPSFTNTEVTALLANGGLDNGLKIKVKLTWNNGTSQQFYTFDEELLKLVYDGSGNRAFQLTVTGIAGIPDIAASPVVAADTGAQATKDGLTLQIS